MAYNPNDSSSLNSYSSSNSDNDSDIPASPAPAPAAPAAPAAPVDVADPLLQGSGIVRNALSHVAASQETPPKSPHDALVVMQLRNIRAAQKNSRGAVFAAGPFDALLVGACGVQPWSAPLVRLLSADARKVVESFLRPRITERAATVLLVAAEKFLTGVFHSALMVATNRNATCVWACDVENAIKICGLERIAGTGRPQAGCACAGLVSASPASTQRALPREDVTDSDEARNAPSVSWRRRPMTWCEAAPLDGSSAQSSIRRSMRWIASRAGVPHLAPGALNTAGSALCAFLSTVVAKARGVQHPLLREAAASDSRVDRLVRLVHTSCAAPLSSDESESESDESESDSDSDTPDMRYAWEHTLRTRWSDTPGHDGLTEKVVRDALEGLDYTVYGGNPFLSDLARAYHERFGRDVLGLLRDGILNVERFLGELDDELKDDVDDHVFGLRLTRSMDMQPRESGSRDARTTNIPTPYCGAVGCLCPGCGRECLLWLVKYLSSPDAPTSVKSLEPVVDMESVRVAQARAGERWTGCVYFDRDPPVAPPKLWTVLPARRRPLRQGMGALDLAARANRMLTETAARRAGFTHWAPEVETLVGDVIKKWGMEIAELARAFHLHETSHREPRTITLHEGGEEVPRDVSVAALSGPLTFSSVARAVVTLLERTQKRFPVLYVRPFDAGSCAAAACRAAFPYAEPLLGPNEMLADWQLLDEFKAAGVDVTDQYGRVLRSVSFDTEANELISRVFAHRLAWLFHRARPVSPVFDLPGGGRGPVLVPHDLFFINACGDYWAQFT